VTPLNVTEAAAKRTAQVNALRDFAAWLERNPDVPMPTLSLHRHLTLGDGTDAENLASVRSIAASLEVGTDEQLDDRTVLRIKVGDHVWYELYAWHKGGRGDIGELERLRAEVERLRAQVDADASGLTYTRADSEPDDPTPVSPARVPLHTGGPVGTVSDSTLVVDETPEHYETGGSVGPNPGDHGRDCACGVSFNGFDTAAEAQTVLDQHIRQASA